MFNINKDFLKKISFLYLMLPLLVFLIGYIKPILGIPMALAFIIAYYFGCINGSEKTDFKNFTNNKFFLSLLFGISLLWCWLGGIGYLYYQSDDHHWRNAIFRDLINHHWPVIYENTQAALVYYIGHWLPAAAMAKGLFLFHMQPEHVFVAGNVFLLLYSAFGVLLVILNMLQFLQCESYKRILFVIFFLMFFSGMDIIGKGHFAWHLEHWARWQYSSHTTVLFWVFNQGIPAWLATMLVINHPKPKLFGLIAVNTLFCAPFPFIGLTIFMLVLTIKEFINTIKSHELLSFLKNEIFNFQNCISIFLLLPIVLLYFHTNANVSGSSSSSIFAHYTIFRLIRLVGFILLEFGIYSMFIMKYYRKNLLFYISFLSLCAIPFFNVISSYDFYMRASIPALIVLTLLLINYLFDTRNRRVLLIFFLFIGSLTPITEFTRGFHYIELTGKINVVADDIQTFNRTDISLENFTAENPKSSAFFKYLAK